jgi:hypothetical protein
MTALVLTFNQATTVQRMNFDRLQITTMIESPKGTDFNKSDKGKQMWKKLPVEKKLHYHALSFMNDVRATKYDMQIIN